MSIQETRAEIRRAVRFLLALDAKIRPLEACLRLSAILAAASWASVLSGRLDRWLDLDESFAWRCAASAWDFPAWAAGAAFAILAAAVFRARLRDAGGPAKKTAVMLAKKSLLVGVVAVLLGIGLKAARGEGDLYAMLETPLLASLSFTAVFVLLPVLFFPSIDNVGMLGGGKPSERAVRGAAYGGLILAAWLAIGVPVDLVLARRAWDPLAAARAESIRAAGIACSVKRAYAPVGSYAGLTARGMLENGLLDPALLDTIGPRWPDATGGWRLRLRPTDDASGFYLEDGGVPKDLCVDSLRLGAPAGGVAVSMWAGGRAFPQGAAPSKAGVLVDGSCAGQAGIVVWTVR